ncbi:MAG: HPr kinase/phosphorylase [Sphingomonas sp.]
MTEASDYDVFGLRVRSEIPLPELFPAADGGEPSVTICVGPVPEANGSEGALNAVNGALVLVIPNVARFRIEQGSRITVEAVQDVPGRNIRLFLLGSAFGALLHQRGLLPLHANAVEIGGKAVAFMGESGAGKSTLAAWFHDRGYRVIADDVCVIGFDEAGRPYAAPGLPRLRLWAEALELMGRDFGSYPRSYVGNHNQDKFDVPIDSDMAATTNVPLAALYVLERGAKLAISTLRGIEAADAVFANTYRGGFVSIAGGDESHWRSAIGVVRSLPVFRVSRKWDLASLDKQCREILDHASAVGRS